MAAADSLFIVLEGLDGSGKTTAGRYLATYLQSYLGGKVKLSFEPNDGCCAGTYIRQVQGKKIQRFSYETLAYAYAANRKDHGDRIIQPWLDQAPGQVLICDRYYLSSLVYQSNEKLSMTEVMQLNQYALQPDVIFFLSVTPEICYQRMDKRNKPQEIFEENFVQTRAKYHQAIDFLREQRNEQVVEIDASLTLAEVVQTLAQQMSTLFSTLAGFADFVKVQKFPEQEEPFAFQPEALPLNLPTWNEQVQSMSFDQRVARFEALNAIDQGSLGLDWLLANGYHIKQKVQLPGVNGFELLYQLPGGLEQQGVVIFTTEQLAPGTLLTAIETIENRTDFIFVLAPKIEELKHSFFQKEVVSLDQEKSRLFPQVRFLGTHELKDWILKS